MNWWTFAEDCFSQLQADANTMQRYLAFSFALYCLGYCDVFSVFENLGVELNTHFRAPYLCQENGTKDYMETRNSCTLTVHC